MMVLAPRRQGDAYRPQCQRVPPAETHLPYLGHGQADAMSDAVHPDEVDERVAVHIDHIVVHPSEVHRHDGEDERQDIDLPARAAVKHLVDEGREHEQEHVVAYEPPRAVGGDDIDIRLRQSPRKGVTRQQEPHGDSQHAVHHTFEVEGHPFGQRCAYAAVAGNHDKEIDPVDDQCVVEVERRLARALHIHLIVGV